MPRGRPRKIMPEAAPSPEASPAPEPVPAPIYLPLWRQTGGIWPLSLPTSLTWTDIGALLHLIRMYGVGLFVEIGVEHGGLAALMMAYSDATRDRTNVGWQSVPFLDYIGIEIDLRRVNTPVLRQAGSRILGINAWSESAVALVAATVRDCPHRALIFCDGGDKPRELHLYQAVLRPGDLLIAHDYHNEYGDEAISDLDTRLNRIVAPWLEDTLLCAFQMT